MRIFAFILAFLSIEACGQTILNLRPQLGRLVDLKPEEEATYKKTEGMELGYYDIVGFPLDSKSSSSSELTDGTTYSAEFAFDLSYGTAWVEGVDGPGIGQFLTLELESDTPPINRLVFVNGFIRSKALWDDYSRVKTIEMTVNEKPFAFLNLENSRQEQEFNFDKAVWDKLNIGHLTMKFKIIDVYKGAKYNRTAITEIYIGGFSVDK